MINFIHFNVKGVYNVMVYELKVGVADPVLHIAFAACKEIINYYDFMTVSHQAVD